MKANWSPFALLVIDVQKDFTDDIGNLEERNDYGSRLADLLDQCRKRDVDVVFIRGKYKADKSDWLNFLKYNNHPVLVEGTDGFAHEPFANEREGERVFHKQTLDAFLNPELDRYLRETKKKFLFIAGFDTSVCVLLTLFHAIQIGYWTCLVEDCCWDENENQKKVISMYKNMIINIKKHDELFTEENHKLWSAMIAGTAVRPGRE